MEALYLMLGLLKETCSRIQTELSVFLKFLLQGIEPQTSDKQLFVLDNCQQMNLM